MIAVEQRLAVIDLITRYAQTIDDDRLEEWPDMFTEDGLYQIVPRENLKQNLPGVILCCYNRDMMRDRIKVLREANEYNIHTDRHVVGQPALQQGSNGELRAITNYALFQTDQEGESELFSVGLYDDVIVFEDGQPLFKERTVVVDTSAIPNLLATPI
jgi:anthranilate 1,2-dioxygenase small subunit